MAYWRSRRYFILLLFFVFSLAERKNEEQLKKVPLQEPGEQLLGCLGRDDQ
jgi:hypothetical protein